MPFTYQLKMGDQIEIITQKQPNPSRDWLNPNLGLCHPSRGRSKIHNWFRKQDRDKNILAGRQMLDNELEHLGISLKEAEKLLIPRYNMNSLDEVLAAIGGGDIRLNQMVNYLQASSTSRAPKSRIARRCASWCSRKRRRRLVTRTTAEWWWRAWAI